MILESKRFLINEAGKLLSKADNFVYYNNEKILNFKLMSDGFIYDCVAKNRIADTLSRQNMALDNYCLITGFLTIKFDDETKSFVYDVAIATLKYV
jgi:hypothetical protein